MNKIIGLIFFTTFTFLIPFKTTAQFTALFEQPWTIKAPTEKERLEQMTKLEKEEYLKLPKETRTQIQKELEEQAKNSTFSIKIDGTFNIDIENYMQQKGIWKLDKQNTSILHITYKGGEQDGQEDKIFIKELTEDKIILTLGGEEGTGQELTLVPKK